MKTTLTGILLALALAGCQPQQQPQEPVPVSPPAAETPAAPADAAPTTEPAAPADPTTTPAAPAQPAPAAPAPTEPSPAPKPTAANLPAVESMGVAKAGAKMSVAADLRYSFDGSPASGQPVTLHLAAIPRVAGTHLNVEIKPAAGLEVSKAALSEQKVEAGGVYRQQYALTRTGAAAHVRVLVTMDMPEGTAFGYFTIPLDAGTTAQKSDSVKQR